MKTNNKTLYRTTLVVAALSLVLPLVMRASDDIIKHATRPDVERQDKPLTLTAEQDAVVANPATTSTSLSSAKPAPTHKAPVTESITVNGVTFKMVKVDGGTYDKSFGTDVYHFGITNMYIGQTEVTQALWQAVMGYNPSRFAGDPNRPVETVSWIDCQAFIHKLNELTGRNFRLPSSAEWEFAARGGTLSNGYDYAGGNDLDAIAWWQDNSEDQTHAVGTKSPNELGLYDMTGNVSEWCQDYPEYYYASWYGNTSDQVNDPWGELVGNYSTIGGNRGGNVRSNMAGCRITFFNTIIINREGFTGLRLAISENNKPNISMMQEQLTVPATTDDVVVPVALKRGNTDGIYRATVNLETDFNENIALASNEVTFADGEKIAYAQVQVTSMTIGGQYSCNVVLSDNDASATANGQYGKQITSTQLIVNRDYDWVAAGTCDLYDETWYDGGATATNVRVEHAVGSNTYRIVSPLYALYNGLEYDPDMSHLPFTLNADNSISIADGTYLNWWGYQMYYTTDYPSYCYIAQDGNKFTINFLLMNGSSLYVGGPIEFTWYGWPGAASVMSSDASRPMVTIPVKKSGTAMHAKKIFTPLH